MRGVAGAAAVAVDGDVAMGDAIGHFADARTPPVPTQAPAFIPCDPGVEVDWNMESGPPGCFGSAQHDTPMQTAYTGEGAGPAGGFVDGTSSPLPANGGDSGGVHSPIPTTPPPQHRSLVAEDANTPTPSPDGRWWALRGRAGAAMERIRLTHSWPQADGVQTVTVCEAPETTSGAADVSGAFFMKTMVKTRTAMPCNLTPRYRRSSAVGTYGSFFDLTQFCRYALPCRTELLFRGITSAAEHVQVGCSTVRLCPLASLQQRGPRQAATSVPNLLLCTRVPSGFGGWARACSCDVDSSHGAALR